MLQKDATSQLSVVSDEAYAAGMARIREVVEGATTGGEVVFPVDLSLAMVTGRVSK